MSSLEANSNFKLLPALKLLKVGKNKLTQLPETIFDGLTNLRRLYLNENELAELDNNILKAMTELRQVILFTNNLETIPNTASLANLSLLDARGNPLRRVNANTLKYFFADATLLVSQHRICECFAPDDLECIASGERKPDLTCGLNSQIDG